jgi:hypothetical protein
MAFSLAAQSIQRVLAHVDRAAEIKRCTRCRPPRQNSLLTLWFEVSWPLSESCWRRPQQHARGGDGGWTAGELGTAGVEGAQPLPLGGAVAEHEVVAVIDQLGSAVSELKADRLNVRRQTGEEQPAVAGVKRASAYCFRRSGVSCSGSMLIE